MVKCHICGDENAQTKETTGASDRLNCLICGAYEISYEALSCLPEL